MSTLFLSIVSSLLYRVGGAGKETIPFANSQFRDIGCSIVVAFVLWQAHVVWYIALACATLVCGLIRTYWQFLFGGEDNMYAHGIGLGLAMTPLYWAGSHWWAIATYTAALGLVMGLMNTYLNKWQVPFRDWIEELGRGFILIFAMKLLFM